MELCVYIIDLFLNYIGSWVRPTTPEIIVHMDDIHIQKDKVQCFSPVSFYIYRCINHNKSIDSVFCYMVLCHHSDQIEQMGMTFKTLYYQHFQTIPKCIGMYFGYPNHTDIEYLFRLFYRRDQKYKGYVYSRYGLWYLSNMKEEEFLFKFRYLYEDGGRKLTNRKKIDQLYANYLLAQYPNKYIIQKNKKTEYTL